VQPVVPGRERDAVGDAARMGAARGRWRGIGTEHRRADREQRGVVRRARTRRAARRGRERP